MDWLLGIAITSVTLGAVDLDSLRCQMFWTTGIHLYVFPACRYGMTWCHDKVLWRRLSSTFRHLHPPPWIWFDYFIRCTVVRFQIVHCRAILCQGKQEMNALFGLSELKARKLRCARWQASIATVCHGESRWPLKMPTPWSHWRMPSSAPSKGSRCCSDRPHPKHAMPCHQLSSCHPCPFFIFPVPVVVEATCACICADWSTVKVDTLSSRLHQHESSLDDLRRKFEAACSNCYACLPWKLWALSIAWSFWNFTWTQMGFDHAELRNRLCNCLKASPAPPTGQWKLGSWPSRFALTIRSNLSVLDSFCS